MTDQSARFPAASDPAPAQLSPIVRQLRRVRTRATWLLVTTGIATLLACFVAVSLSVGLADYVLRTPGWFRTVLWVIGIAGLVVAVRRWLAPAWRFRPGLTEVALRLERSEEGQKAGLAGVLASGLELAERNEPSATTRWMADHVVDDARRRFAAVRASAILDRRQTRHALLTLAICLAGALAIGFLAGPRLSAIGAARVLAPWAGVQWPKRTAVADATSLAGRQTVHPLGMALPLRAAITRTDRAQSETRVAAVYRLIDSTGAAPLKRILLTGQGRPVALDEPAPGEPASGELYERLIEPGALAAAGAAEAQLEYWFETDDDRTEPRRIRLVPPPAIVAAEATVTPPAYIGSAAPGKAFAAGRLELGAGSDQRSVVGPVLAGSAVEFKIRFNKPLPGPPEGDAAAEWLASTFPGAQPAGVQAEYRGDEWTLRWTARDTVRLPVRPTDEHGLRPSEAEEATFSFDVAQDRPPTVTVIEPRQDEAVLATAVVEVAGEARDDVGIGSLGLTRQVARSAKGSLGAAPEPAGEQEAIPGTPTAEPAAGPTQSGIAATLDLSGLGLKPGEELWLRAVASDTYSFEGATHEPVQSSPRKLRIIREEELIDQVRAELAAVRKTAIRMEGEQAELRKSAQAGSVSADERRRQAGLTQRLEQQREAMERLEQRLERNKLDDETLSGVLSDVSSLLQSAAAESEQASAKMDAAAKDQPEAERAPLTPEETQEVNKAQDAVREQLSRLAEMLDRGEDSWLVSRSLQRLAEQQRELQARTQRAGERNMGKRAEDLTPQERSELAEIAEQQQRLSDTARQTIDQLAERAKQLEKADAAQAEAMKKAAERGRQEQVPQKMEEAAKNAQQNQTSTANEQQEAAAESLEQMLQDMNDAQKNRDETLRRVLANIIQSLDNLIREQDAQITALANADGKFEGLDAPMIALNQNTLGVADQARGDRSMARVAELIDRAAKSQESAIALLRAAPVVSEEVEKAERESLRLLRLARGEAQKVEEEAKKRDADRKRQELRKIYREALEQQVALKAETDPFIGKTVDRRDRMKVRGLGERQETLRVSMDDVRKKTAEMDEAGVFDYAHKRLDLAAGSAGKKLRAGQADRAVPRNQAAVVSILTALVQALDDQAKQDDEFQDDQGGGGGGGGEGADQKPPLLPPLAELRLLRAMQQEAADATRAIDDAKESAAAEELSGLGELQRGLSDRGQELIKKLQQPGPGQMPELPGGDKP